MPTVQKSGNFLNGVSKVVKQTLNTATPINEITN
jgi:hypothetical protein